MFRDKNYGKITENFEPDFERNFRKIPEFCGADRVLQKKTGGLAAHVLRGIRHEKTRENKSAGNDFRLVQPIYLGLSEPRSG